MSESKQPRILYVEDDRAAAGLFQRRLTRAGFEVDLAYDGEEGLAEWETGAYDVIAVVQDMPKKTGLRMIEELALKGPLPLTIMVTGAGSEQIAVQAMKLGAEDYVIKDAEARYLDLLPAIINRALEKKRLLQEKEDAQKALGRSEERFRLMVEHLPAGAVYREGESVLLNRGAEAITGYSRAEISSVDQWFAALFGQQAHELRRRYEEDRKAHFPDPRTIPLTTRDGNTRLAIFTAYGWEQGEVWLLLDETARLQAEAKLEWESRVNAALADLYVPVLSPSQSIYDLTHVVLEKAKALTGSQQGYVGEIDPASGDLIVHTLTKMSAEGCAVSGGQITFPADHDGAYPKLFGHCLNTRKGFYTNSPSKHPASGGVPDGHIPIERFLSVPVMIGDELVGQIAVANPEEDYTDVHLKALARLAQYYALGIQRKRWEATLTRSEGQHRLLLQNLHAAVVVHAPDTSIILWNNVAASLLGLAEEKMKGRKASDPLWKFVREDGSPMPVEEYPVNRVLCEGQPTTNLVAGIDRPDCEERIWVLVNAYPVLTEGGALQHVVVTFVDVTERKWAGQSFQDSEWRLRQALDAARGGSFFYDVGSDTNLWDERSLAIFGLTSTQFGRTYQAWVDCIHPEDWPQVERKVNQVMSSPREGVIDIEHRIIRADGEIRHVRTQAVVIRDEEGNAANISGLHFDTTDRKRAEDALKESERRLAQIIEFLPDATFVVDAEGTVVAWNRAIERLTGMARNEIIGKSGHEYAVPLYGKRRPVLIDLVRHRDREIENQYLSIREEEETLVSESYHPDLKPGGAYLSGTARVLYDSQGNLAGAIESIRDITNQKRMEEQLRASIKEKEVLMREIHHRVKNNFQMIIGLLVLQSNCLDDANYVAMFKEAEARINTIARIYEKLYESENLAEIKIDEYLKAVAHDLAGFYSNRGGRIAIKTDIEPLILDIDSALPCGLIINELVSNAMKHAFGDHEHGEVGITLRALETNECELVVNDNGRGLPEGLDIESTQSLGLRLVNAFAKRFDGKIQTDRSKGTAIRIVFSPDRAVKGSRGNGEA